jgi:3-oxoadipate enol-lactonase
MMSTADISVQHERFNCRLDGPERAPLVVLSNSLGTNLSMWEEQMPKLTRRFRVLRYDMRGHGASSVTPGPYTVAQLGRDVLGLLEAIKVSRVHFCGLSLGGMIGMWLALNAPERIDRLVLANTAPQIGSAEMWNTRIESVHKGGLEAIADGVMERWFSRGFRDRKPEAVARMRAMLTSTSPDGYVAACAAVRDMDQRDVIRAIRQPTLIVAGTHDASTPPAEGRKMAEAIAGARYVELDAAHISNIEAADPFTAELTGFLPG